MNNNLTELTTYIGTRESMGAVFSIVRGNHRVIMDFGAPFIPEQKPYVKHDDNWIKDKIALGLLPAIDGLYPKKYLEGSDLIPAEESPIHTSVFVSHLHLDHMANIGALAPGVKVYLSETARSLEMALEDIGQGVDSVGRDYDIFQPDQCIKEGDIRVTPIINGTLGHQMYGFLVETDDLKVGYTADLSLAGECPELVKREMQIFKDRKVDVLYCDCCNFTDDVLTRFFGTVDPDAIVPDEKVPEGMLDYMQHYEKLEQLYSQKKGLIIFNYYEREIQDADWIMKWAEKYARKAVFSPDAGYLIYKTATGVPNVYPDDRWKDEKWYQELLENCPVVSLEDIKKEPDRYYLHLKYEDRELISQFPNENGLYIHADGYPFTSGEIRNLKEKAELAGFRFASYDDPQYYQHGYPSQIEYFVQQIDPKVVIGYHGRHPERIRAYNGYNLVPERYISYCLADGKLVKRRDL